MTEVSPADRRFYAMKAVTEDLLTMGDRCDRLASDIRTAGWGPDLLGAAAEDIRRLARELADLARQLDEASAD